MQPHVSPQQLHFPPATPPRSEPAQLSPGCRPDFLPASLFNTDESVPAIFQPALSGWGSPHPFAHLHPMLNSPGSPLSTRSVQTRAFFRSLIFLSPPGRIVAKHISPLAYGSVSLTAAHCAHKAIRKYYSNLIRIRIAQGRAKRRQAAIAHVRETTRRPGFLPPKPLDLQGLRTSARRLADVAPMGTDPASSRSCACLRNNSQTRRHAAKALGSSRVAHVGGTTRRSFPLVLIDHRVKSFLHNSEFIIYSHLHLLCPPAPVRGSCLDLFSFNLKSTIPATPPSKANGGATAGTI